jgi:glycosyltransferase involved in cell wall biosynthesis
MSSTKLSVIVAAYNEANNIRDTLRRINATVPDAEIMVVDDGSLDATGDVAARAARELGIADFRLIAYRPNRGKGHAMIEGINHAAGEVMVQVDADSQFPPEDIPRLLQPIADGRADIVFGSRYCAGATCERGSVTSFAVFASWVASRYTRLLSGYRLNDVMAGFKAWKREVILDLDIRCEHFGYEPEIAVKASRKHYRIVEVPVHYKARTAGRSKVSLIRDGVKIILYLLKVKLLGA